MLLKGIQLKSDLSILNEIITIKVVLGFCYFLFVELSKWQITWKKWILILRFFNFQKINLIFVLDLGKWKPKGSLNNILTVIQSLYNRWLRAREWADDFWWRQEPFIDSRKFTWLSISVILSVFFFSITTYERLSSFPRSFNVFQRT